jgi:hypothetical protein
MEGDPPQKGIAPMCRPLLLCCAVLGLALGGCKSCDKVETALRSTEDSLRETREELARQGVYTAALEHEMRIIRGEIFGGPPGQPVAVFPVRSVVFGSQTGGHDAPNGLGDDGLQVILEPRNAEGKPIQVPGEAIVQVLEITPEGFKRLLSSWLIDKDMIKAAWRQGLLSQGYNIILPWKVPPSSEKLRLVAQFKLEDGRVFEADKDVTIRLPKGTPAPAPRLETLPPPRTPTTPTPPIRPMPPPNEVSTPVIMPPPPGILNPGTISVPVPSPSRVPLPAPKKPEILDGPSLGLKPTTDPAVRPISVEMGLPR